MNFREKVFTQIVVCCMIFTTVKAGGILNIEKLKPLKEAAKESFGHHYTAEEVKAAGSELLERAKTVPTMITTAVESANELGEFGQPIDEDTNIKTRCVYATNGGEVISSGISKDLGCFVRIRHADSISTYGNLTTVKAVQGDKVKKGDIIGTYEKQSEKNFYYDLEENLQT